jgi:hypothetical protein
MQDMATQPRPGKRALTVRLDAALIERVKKTVRDASGRPLYLNLGGFVEAALLKELDRVEAILDQAYRDPDDPPIANRLNNRRTAHVR